MFKSIYEDLIREYRFSNKVVRLIFVNIIVFVLLKLVSLVIMVATGGQGQGIIADIVHGLSISSDPGKFFLRLWTWITHIFLHVGFFHLVFNMLYLYWFGRIAGDLLGDRRIYPLYFIGAWVGMLFFFLFSQIFSWLPSGAYAYGASAAVMAITAAAGAIAPDYEIRLIFIGSVKIKYIVAILLLIDLFSVGASNSGGHIAHLGGMAWGFFYVYLLRQGTEVGGFINRILDPSARIFPKKERNISKLRSNLYVSHRKESTQKELDHEDKLNAILDKIAKDGISSLNSDEKEFLENASARKDS